MIVNRLLKFENKKIDVEIFFYSTEFANLTAMLSMKMKNIWQSSVDRISDSIALSSDNARKNSQQNIMLSAQKQNIPEIATIVFVLPLAGRFQTLQRFLQNYEHVCLQHPDTTTQLLVVLFDEFSGNLQPFYREIDQLQLKYKPAVVNYITVHGNFSRGIALNHAIHSKHIQLHDILFFIDVDITFTETSIKRIRLNTKMHEQVYLPIVFSEYDPKVWMDAFQKNDSPALLQTETESINLHYSRGYFRQFGYGICAIFKADILHPNISGFNDDITGWGLEDVKFLEKLVKMHETPINSLLKGTDTNGQNSSVVPLSLSIFRAPDPTLIHIYHDIYCDKTLTESQYLMCLGTKANTFGSYKYIESIYMNNQTIIDFARKT